MKFFARASVQTGTIVHKSEYLLHCLHLLRSRSLVLHAAGGFHVLVFVLSTIRALHSGPVWEVCTKLFDVGNSHENEFCEFFYPIRRIRGNCDFTIVDLLAVGTASFSGLRMHVF